jgi:hypothetical protein
MNCPRCGTLLYLEIIFTESGKYKTAICYKCGEQIDPQILENRLESLARIRARRKNRPVLELDSSC